MTGVLNGLAASDKGLDLGTVLEVLKHLIHRNVLLQNFAHRSNDTNGDRFLVGIYESATDDAVGAVASEEPRCAFTRVAQEARLNDIGRKLDGFLRANSYLMDSGSLLGKTSLGSQQGVDTIGKDNHIRSDLIAESVDALNLAVFNDQVLYGNTVDELSTSILSLLGKPLVEGTTKNGVRLLAGLFELAGGIIDGEVGVGRHERDTLMRDLALQRSFLVVREHLGERMRIDTATGHVLCASVLTTLDDKNRLSGGREGVSSNRTCAACTDDDRVKIGHAFPFRE